MRAFEPPSLELRKGPGSSWGFLSCPRRLTSSYDLAHEPKFSSKPKPKSSRPQHPQAPGIKRRRGPKNFKDYVPLESSRAEGEDCTRDRFSQKKLPRSIDVVVVGSGIGGRSVSFALIFHAFDSGSTVLEVVCRGF